MFKFVLMLFFSAMCLFSLYAVSIVFQSNYTRKKKFFGVLACLFSVCLWMIYIFATVYPALASLPGISIITLVSIIYLLAYCTCIMLRAHDFISAVMGGYLLFFGLIIVLLICISVAMTLNILFVFGAMLTLAIILGAVYLYIYKNSSSLLFRLLVTIIMYLLVIGGLSCVFAVTVDLRQYSLLEAFYESLQNSFALPESSHYIWIHILQFFACRIIDFTMFGIVVHIASGYIDFKQPSNLS